MPKYAILIIITIFSLFSMLFDFSENYSTKAFSLNEATQSIIKNDSWISKRDNLNVTIKLMPSIPVIDETTKLLK